MSATPVRANNPANQQKMEAIQARIDAFTAQQKAQRAAAQGNGPPTAQFTNGAPLASAARAMVPVVQAINAAQLKLYDVQIDVHQVRRYLPEDLREQISSGKLAPAACLEALTKRAARDEVSKRYLADITELAESIYKHGQIVPALVTRAPNNARVRYQLVDGERRYWALNMLSQREPNRTWTLKAEFAIDTLSAEAIQQVQLATNFKRRALSTMDLVDLISAQKALWDKRLAMNRDQYLPQIKASAEQIAKRGAAACATATDMNEITGRPFTAMTVQAYATIAEHLSVEAKAFARVHELGVRALAQIATWDPAKQLEELTRRSEASALLVDEESHQSSAPKPVIASPGRPSKQASIKTALQRLRQTCETMSDKLMRRMSKQELTELRESLHGAIGSMQERHAACERILRGK